MPNAPTTPVGPLASPRHEKFALLMADGTLAAWEAYQLCYPRAAEATCRTEGPALLRLPHVSERVRNIQNGAAKRVAMDIDEWRQFHEDIMRTPIADINEHHPLAQEVTYITLAGNRPKKGEEPDPAMEVVKVKMPSKLEAAKNLGAHHGWNGKEKLELTAADSLLDVLAQIRQPGIPKVPADALAEELANVPEVPVPGFLVGGNVPAVPPP